MKPKGFWSYARGDDAALDRELTRLRARVAEEVSLLLGEEVEMFQDIHDIRTGDDWEARLRAELTDASFMIPVLTPRYFTRPWCREEVMTYLRLAKDRGVPARLFPLYVVRDRRFDEGEPCEVRKAVSRYQFFDWRELRFEESEKKVSRGVHVFAESISGMLENAPKSTGAKARVRRKAKKSKSHQADLPQKRESPKAPDVVTSTRYTVDKWPGRGDFTTISQAIEAAEEGGQIVVHPGIYEEALQVDKVVELIGEGARDDVSVTVTSGVALTVSARLGKVRNFRLVGDVGTFHTTPCRVTYGQYQFEECTFFGKTNHGAFIEGGQTAPVFNKCIFDDNAGTGIAIATNASPRFVACQSNGNGDFGIFVCNGANPDVRDSRFCDNNLGGGYAFDKGRGYFHGCEFSDNRSTGFRTERWSKPRLRHCRIQNNHGSGILAGLNGAGGSVTDCVLTGNANVAFEFEEEGKSQFQRWNNIEK